MLSIFTTVIPSTGRASPSANARREQMARAVLQRASDDGVQLVVFPAGVLRARGESDLEATASGLLEAAATLRLAIVFGIDTESASTKQRGNRVGRGSLPYFVVAQSMTGDRHFWRQRSSTAKNGYDTPTDALARRTLRIGRTEIDVLACGEVFNHRLRKRLEPWTERIVVVPTHTARGARFFHAFEWSRAAGMRAMLRATHASSATTAVGTQTMLVGRIDDACVLRWTSPIVH